MAASNVIKQGPNLGPAGGPGSITETFKDEQFEDNLQEQRDEILALTAIFNTEDDEKMKVLSEVNEENDGLFTLLINVLLKPTADSIHVDVALPVEQEAEMEMAAAAAPSEESGPPNLGPKVQLNRSISGRNWHGSFKVKYLSPLYLFTTLPPSYPSSESPQFHLSCDWLTESQLNSVGSMLDTLWKEGSQMPILFTWVDWLENNLLSHLGITDHLVLRPPLPQIEPDGDGAQNMDQWEEDVGEIIATMIRFNQEQTDIEFCQSMQECHVCYDEKQGTQFFRMHDCDHHYCHMCMAQFCEMHVTEGTVEALRCPDRKCDSIVPPYIVQAVMGPEAYERWETLLLQKTLDAMADTVYCPRCGSLVIAEAEEELHLAHCPVCYFAFCTQCERGWHQGRNCATDEEMLEELQDRQNKIVRKNAAEEAKFQELMRKFEEEMKSKQTKAKATRNCPSCKVPVEKIGGCNKMTCKCGNCFCWVCGKAIEGYSHFRTSGCILFPGQTAPAVVGVVRQPAEGAIRIRARIAVNPDLANNRCFCPMCKQMNLKGEDRNNHIKCWNCKTNFCFLCKQRILGNVMAHFVGPCNQHS